MSKPKVIESLFAFKFFTWFKLGKSYGTWLLMELINNYSKLVATNPINKVMIETEVKKGVCNSWITCKLPRRRVHKNSIYKLEPMVTLFGDVNFKVYRLKDHWLFPIKGIYIFMMDENDINERLINGIKSTHESSTLILCTETPLKNFHWKGFLDYIISPSELEGLLSQLSIQWRYR